MSNVWRSYSAQRVAWEWSGGAGGVAVLPPSAAQRPLPLPASAPSASASSASAASSVWRSAQHQLKAEHSLLAECERLLQVLSRYSFPSAAAAAAAASGGGGVQALEGVLHLSQVMVEHGFGSALDVQIMRDW